MILLLEPNVPWLFLVQVVWQEEEVQQQEEEGE